MPHFPAALTRPDLIERGRRMIDPPKLDGATHEAYLCGKLDYLLGQATSYFHQTFNALDGPFHAAYDAGFSEEDEDFCTAVMALLESNQP